MLKPGLHGNNNENLELPKNQMKKALVSFVIEQSLIENGGIEIFEKTVDILKKNLIVILLNAFIIQII